MENYRITCSKCKMADVVGIADGNLIIWGNQKVIISGRYRLDRQWGWQCFCGNNDILTKQEQRKITNKQSPDPKEINQILKNLVPDKPLFSMDRV